MQPPQASLLPIEESDLVNEIFSPAHIHRHVSFPNNQITHFSPVPQWDHLWGYSFLPSFPSTEFSTLLTLQSPDSPPSFKDVSLAPWFNASIFVGLDLRGYREAPYTFPPHIVLPNESMDSAQEIHFIMSLPLYIYLAASSAATLLVSVFDCASFYLHGTHGLVPSLCGGLSLCNLHYLVYINVHHSSFPR
ncbi:hypothetical protein VKT23_002770 [Stygiomarasmius scandens]|uniref:Uncharacterized protein n=1 Tax=Marasmiellus scandens TaxID=2682957 RepID=A0ABR1JZF1_9AGAR